jgi:hypothetical protein
MPIDAGATVEFGSYDGSPWQGCVEFEGEQSLWASMIPNGMLDHDNSSPYAGGVLISNKTRPYIREKGRGCAAFKHRIDEIVDILGVLDFDARGLLPYAIASAARKWYAYTVSCLVRVSEAISVTKASDLAELSLYVEYLPLDASVMDCLEKRRAIRDEAFRASKNDENGLSRFERLIHLREYQHAEMAIREADCLQTYHCGETVLHCLVRHRYASMLAQVCSHAMASKLEDFDRVSP